MYPTPLTPLFILVLKDEKKITETELLDDYFAYTILQPHHSIVPVC